MKINFIIYLGDRTSGLKEDFQSVELFVETE